MALKSHNYPAFTCKALLEVTVPLQCRMYYCKNYLNRLGFVLIMLFLRLFRHAYVQNMHTVYVQANYSRVLLRCIDAG